MNIEELKALEARATKGPWIDHGGRVGVEVEGTGTLPDGSPYPTRDLAGPVADAGDNDRPLICALRNAAKPLLAVVRAGEALMQHPMYSPLDMSDEARAAIEARKALRAALATLKETTL